MSDDIRQILPPIRRADLVMKHCCPLALSSRTRFGCAHSGARLVEFSAPHILVQHCPERVLAG